MRFNGPQAKLSLQGKTMLLRQVFESFSVWNMLATVSMEPLVTYKILKYIKLVEAEYLIADNYRVALTYKITNTRDIEEAQIKPNTPEYVEYVARFDEILSVECTLEKFDLTLETVLESIREDYTLTVQDLILLEPFFID